MTVYKPTFGEVLAPAPIKSDRDIISSVGSSYILPEASEVNLGGVKVDGTSITISGGVISSHYTLPTASTTVLGGVKVDGTSILIDGDGKISISGSGTGEFISSLGSSVDREVLIWNGITGKYIRTPSYVSISDIGTVSAGADVIAYQTVSPTGSYWDNLPAATSTTIGGFILDATQMEMNAGVLSIIDGILTPAEHEHSWDDITSGTQPDPVAHSLTSATYHTVSGLTTGHYLKASAADAVGFGTLAASSVDNEILRWDGITGNVIHTASGVVIDDDSNVVADGDVVAYQSGSYSGSIWDAIPVDDVTLKYSGGYVSIKPTLGTAGQALIVNDEEDGIEWGTVSGGGSSQWTTSGSNIYYNTGNVGIGTASPNRLLTAKGIIAAEHSGDTTQLALLNNGSVSIISSTYNGAGGYTPIYINTSDTTRIAILNNGNVGIGMTNPGYRLDIVGEGSNWIGTLYGVFSVNQDKTNHKGIVLGYDSASQTGTIMSNTPSAASNIAFWTYSGSAWGERMRITGGGAVYSTGNMRVGATLRDTGILSGNGMEFFWNSGNSSFYIEPYNYTTSAYQSLRIAGNPTLFLAGNVGIGYDSPGYRLHVNYPVGSAWLSRFTNSSTGGGDIYLCHMGHGMHINPGSAATVNTYGLQVVDYTGANAFWVGGTGRIGVGIASPTFEGAGVYGMHIHNTASATSEIHITNGATGSAATDGLSLEVGSTGVAYLWNQENTNMVFGNNNTTKMTLTAAGTLNVVGDVVAYAT